MEYVFPDPPDNKPFQRMTQKEANAYFEWFVGSIPTRISILNQFVTSHSDARFQNWNADNSLNSLLVLGEWFATQVGKQQPSEDYKEFVSQHRTSSQLYVRFPQIVLPNIDWIPSDKTMALTIDIGMYMGQIFTKYIHNALWIIMREDETNIDYNQPVIGGMIHALNHMTVHCNTIAIVHTIALSYINKTRPKDALFTVCDTWINNMQQRNTIS